MYLINEPELRNLCQAALSFDALTYEGVEEHWPLYFDALEKNNVICWDDEQEDFIYTSKVDELMEMYNRDVLETPLINDLLDLINLIDHKISLYEQKTTQFANGSMSALIFVKEKLKEIMNEYKS